MSEDGRKKLRAHWPPRLKQTVQVEIPDWLYADIYACAKAEGWSFADEIRARLRPAAGRKPNRASAGQAAPPEGQPPAGGDPAREAK